MKRIKFITKHKLASNLLVTGFLCRNMKWICKNRTDNVASTKEVIISKHVTLRSNLLNLFYRQIFLFVRLRGEKTTRLEYLHVVAALVGTEHDDVGRPVVEVFLQGSRNISIRVVIERGRNVRTSPKKDFSDFGIRKCTEVGLNYWRWELFSLLITINLAWNQFELVRASKLPLTRSKSSDCINNLMYAPPHSSPRWNFTSNLRKWKWKSHSPIRNKFIRATNSSVRQIHSYDKIVHDERRTERRQNADDQTKYPSVS